MCSSKPPPPPPPAAPPAMTAESIEPEASRRSQELLRKRRGTSALTIDMSVGGQKSKGNLNIPTG